MKPDSKTGAKDQISTRDGEHGTRLVGQVDDDKIGLRIQIVLARFVEDVDIAFLGLPRVRDDLIDLAKFQIVAMVVSETQSKLGLGAGRSMTVTPETA